MGRSVGALQWVIGSVILGLLAAPSSASSADAPPEPTERHGVMLAGAIEAAVPTGWTVVERAEAELPYGHYWGAKYDGPRGRLVVLAGPRDAAIHWRDASGAWYREVIAKEALKLWVMPAEYRQSGWRFLKPMRPVPATQIFSGKRGSVYALSTAHITAKARFDEIVATATETNWGGRDPESSWPTWEPDLRTALERATGSRDAR